VQTNGGLLGCAAIRQLLERTLNEAGRLERVTHIRHET